MKAFIKSAVSFVVIMALSVAAFSYFFGTTTVKAKFAETPLEGAKVFIDGKEVGKTPYQARLTPGIYSIKVVPPDGYESKQSEYSFELFTVCRGAHFEAPFDPTSTEE